MSLFVKQSVQFGKRELKGMLAFFVLSLNLFAFYFFHFNAVSPTLNLDGQIHRSVFHGLRHRGLPLSVDRTGRRRRYVLFHVFHDSACLYC
jgi:hypothetical protein